jgi:hemoglobin
VLNPTTPVTGAALDEGEKAIAACVQKFYATVRQDSLLGPFFTAKIGDWDAHLRTIENFWSRTLLRTERYAASPFAAHMNLPIEPAHFDRWLQLFEAAARETLPPDLAAEAVAKARLMAASFKAGIFPFVDAQGRPSRHPAART